MAHLEIGLECPSLKPPRVGLLLKGQQHWESVSHDLIHKPKRTPVTVELMELIKRKLYEISWDVETKFRF